MADVGANNQFALLRGRFCRRRVRSFWGGRL